MKCETGYQAPSADFNSSSLGTTKMSGIKIFNLYGKLVNHKLMLQTSAVFQPKMQLC